MWNPWIMGINGTWLTPLKTTLIVKKQSCSLPGAARDGGTGGGPRGWRGGTVPAVVSWPRRRRISIMALYRSPLASQNWGEQPEYSQAPTAPVDEGCARLLPRARPA